LQDDLARLIRSTRGDCPGDDELHSYFRGILKGKDSSGLSSHIELCGICQTRLKRLEDFERALVQADSESPGWKSAEERLRRKIRNMASGKDGGKGSKTPLD
jgi:hypothetical protein